MRNRADRTERGQRSHNVVLKARCDRSALEVAPTTSLIWLWGGTTEVEPKEMRRGEWRDVASFRAHIGASGVRKTRSEA